MKTKKFWAWNEAQEATGETPAQERTLVLSGTIAEESWLDDDVTPKMFKQELDAGEGGVTVWLNSPGGDCFAAAQIYNMLAAYPGRVTVKVDAIAASAASVIAMAGDEVQMSPVAMLMIHNPAMLAKGDHNDMEKAIAFLGEVKEGIINAYAAKTGLSRAKLSRLMESETWMDAKKAVELGFADSIIGGEAAGGSTLYSERELVDRVVNKLAARETPKPANIAAPKAVSEQPAEPQGRSVKELQDRLDIIKRFI